MDRLKFDSGSLLLTTIRLYIYSLPFTYALSLSDGRITISLLLSVVLAFLLLFRLALSSLSFPKLTIAFAAFLAFLFSLFFGLVLGGLNSLKSINHYFAYAFSIFGFGLIPMLAVANLSRPAWSSLLLNDIIWTARIAAIAVVLQFIGANFFGVFFEDYIFYPESIESQSMHFGLFFRSRGFAAEPGHYAFILELLTPILFYGNSVRRNKSYLIFFVDLLLILLAFLSTASPAGLMILCSGLLISAIIFPARRRAPIILLVIIAVLLAVGFVSIVGNQTEQVDALDVIASMFLDKLDSNSASERIERFEVGIKLFENISPLQLIFGYGPAVYVTQGLGDQTIIQFYLLLFLESGIFGVILFFAGFLTLIVFALKNLGDGRLFFFWALLNITLHYFVISNYWYPMIWFMFPLLLIMQAEQKRLSISLPASK